MCKEIRRKNVNDKKEGFAMRSNNAKGRKRKIIIELFVELFLSRFPFIIFTLMLTFVPVT